ncbi:ABC-2 type transport system permease protein [Sinobacterium caligoides]|uniref:ABC-2 type transport system permease protein n=1 Tax=Sinobacterium caligoides TaxID=933926 RepID=A0A3N2E0C5_9GAMM|nr:ABC transporter permease [Sinobacterium caligoides]ROS05362.1 ABC-2 type transport system permease protein [Sinobacterium caligoides]
MNFWRLLRCELKAILSESAIVLTVFGGLLLYSVLYPLPYLNQTTTEQPTVLVDLDQSNLSRRLGRYLDATPQISINHRATSLNEAQALIASDQSRGVVVIPKNFKRDLLRAKSPTVAIAANANYMLVYSAIAEGAVKANLAISKEVKGAILLAKGGQSTAVGIAIDPIELSSVPIFNLNLGYLGYLVPALFVLLLHQTLLIGTGILGASQWRQAGYWREVSAWQLVLARCCAFGLIYSGFSLYYFGWCFYLYDVSRLAGIAELLLLVLPWLLASTAFGICLSSAFQRRDRPTQFYVIVSMPILFVSGFVWPSALIPDWLVTASYAIPAIPAIHAMLQLNQMGGAWVDSLPYWLGLWLMFVIYGLAACWLVGRRQSIAPPETAA